MSSKEENKRKQLLQNGTLILHYWGWSKKSSLNYHYYSFHSSISQSFIFDYLSSLLSHSSVSALAKKDLDAVCKEAPKIWWIMRCNQKWKTSLIMLNHWTCLRLKMDLTWCLKLDLAGRVNLTWSLTIEIAKGKRKLFLILYCQSAISRITIEQYFFST